MMSLPSISYVVSVDTLKSPTVSIGVVPVKLMAERDPLVLNLVTPVTMIRATFRQQKQHCVEQAKSLAFNLKTPMSMITAYIVNKAMLIVLNR